MKTFVYVDAFNLYYGALKNTAYKWLNIRRMCELSLPKNQIEHICICTARVKARAGDPQQPVRQAMLFRALKTLPDLEIIEGHFLEHKVYMQLVSPPPGGPDKVRVLKTEEKGSDVNLATALLRDAYENRFDVAVIVSGDSDLLAPIQIVKDRLNKPVGVLSPQRRPCYALKQAASFHEEITAGILAASQFPDPMQDAVGPFYKPAAW